MGTWQALANTRWVFALAKSASQGWLAWGFLETADVAPWMAARSLAEPIIACEHPVGVRACQVREPRMASVGFPRNRRRRAMDGRAELGRTYYRLRTPGGCSRLPSPRAKDGERGVSRNRRRRAMDGRAELGQ